MKIAAITITKAQLQEALEEWEQVRRLGLCQHPETVDAKSVEQVAKESAGYFWDLLLKGAK